MVETTVCKSGLAAVRMLRVSLVDELEGQIDSLVEVLLCQGVFSRDDREEVLCQPGPRARVRKVLDILECKGEEAAKIFLSLRSRPQHSREGDTDQPRYTGNKMLIMCVK